MSNNKHRLYSLESCDDDEEDYQERQEEYIRSKKKLDKRKFRPYKYDEDY